MCHLVGDLPHWVGDLYVGGGQSGEQIMRVNGNGGGQSGGGGRSAPGELCFDLVL
jgi:hypothetical protein